MDINPSEVTKILKEQIKKFGDKSEVTEIGQVLSVGDGIAEYTVLTMFKLEKWLSSLMGQKEWH